ncbi:RNA deprotection pyrophosphohydrolase [Mesobacillus harenae]|uniref:RNA deprotection pyrophosphohydrolase n=1 Tax=Mesobacillus harenae TaxID=2213203 RepID=UPI00158023CA|nr:nucleoside triphosphatase YtkD [Mesobacillus harenae]
MEKFYDMNGEAVSLSLSTNAFSMEPEHVLVICRYQEKWLMTDHKKRGWEFPGGKREQNESLEETAHREVYEETGARLAKLIPIGEYKIGIGDTSFVKRVYYGEAGLMESLNSFYETNGPVLVSGDLLEDRFKPHFSFIMKDKVIEKCIGLVNYI